MNQKSSDINLQEKLEYIDENIVQGSGISSIGDKLAQKESQSFAKQQADQIKEQGIKFHKLFFQVACLLIWFFAILFIILVLVWFIHLIVPVCYRWLDSSEIQAIERILFASTLISFAGKYFAKFKLLEAN